MNWLIGGFTVMLVIAFGVISWAIYQTIMEGCG